jgi:hypothetical protein
MEENLIIKIKLNSSLSCYSISKFEKASLPAFGLIKSSSICSKNYAARPPVSIEQRVLGLRLQYLLPKRDECIHRDFVTICHNYES